MTPQQALEAEESLLDPDIRMSTQLVEPLADKFIEFGSSGRVYTKDDLVAVLQAESPVVQRTSNFQLMTLAPDVALLTYKVRRHSEPVVDTLRPRCGGGQTANGRWFSIKQP